MALRRWGFTLMASLALAATAGMSRAETLGIGDPAPKLAVKSFVKGEPLKALETGKVHVIEFWATWCGPCRVSIPHLTQLQKKHPEAIFLGVSIWEQDQEEVKPFVEKMGDKMAYRVAVDSIPEKGDGNDGLMAKTWMNAAGRNGIPTAFIINREGKIAWLGHPMQMDATLEKVIAGKWDLKSAIAEQKQEAEQQERLKKLQARLETAQKSGDPKKLLAAIDEAVQEMPPLADRLGMMKLNTLVKMGETQKALELGKHLGSEVFGDNADALSALAWISLNGDEENAKVEEKLVAFALETARRADKLAASKSPDVADTLARAYFAAGQIGKALETQERAVELAKGTQLEANPGLKKRLAQYKRAAAK